jgi:alpha-aminoadipic semialdehyde synthase
VVRGEGLQIMAVDILPSELPRDSSLGFSNILKNYVYPIAKANYNASTIDEIELPLPIKRALILHKGQLTPDYKYIQKYLE